MKKYILIVGILLVFLSIPAVSTATLGPSSDTPYGVAINPKAGQCVGLTWGDYYDGKDRPSPAWQSLRYSQVSKLETAAGTCYLDQQNTYPESCCETLGLQYIEADIPEPSVVSQPYTVCNNGYYEGHNASCPGGESQKVTGNITRECDYQNEQTILAINVENKTCSVGYKDAGYVKQSRYVPGNAENAGGEITGHNNEPADARECPALDPAIESTQAYTLDYGVSGMPIVAYLGVASDGKYCDVYGNEDPAACCRSLGYQYIGSLTNSGTLYSPYILGGLLVAAIGYFILRPKLLPKTK